MAGDMAATDEVFRALADANRRRLLDSLNVRGGQSLRELCGDLTMARQAVSKHLAVLESADLVTSTRQGREKLHYLNAEPIDAVAGHWIGQYRRELGPGPFTGGSAGSPRVVPAAPRSMSRPEGRGATIKAVADRANVSPSTVYYVLSGTRSISEGTKRRVRRAVEELGYEPNSSARALRTSKTNVLALMGFVDAVYTEAGDTGALMIAMAEAVRQRGYDLLLMPTNEGAAGVERLARAQTVDAVIVMGILMQDPRVDALRRLELPAALLGRPELDPGISWVDLDFAGAGRVGVDLLAAQGHDGFAFIGPPAHVYADGAGYAVRGLQGALEAAGRNRMRVVGQVNVETVAELGSQLEEVFTVAPDLSAIVLQHDEVLPELLRWLRAGGRRVPRDVQVTVIGGWTHHVTESEVTYVSSTVDRLASAVVSQAIEATFGTEPRSVLLPPEVWQSRR
jgi:DNA-binding LacI/PurR family transcriptional regulator/DNA-binding transcriptional ArsR family regulator